MKEPVGLAAETGCCPVCSQLVPLDGEGRILEHSRVLFGSYQGICKGTGRKSKPPERERPCAR